MRTSILLSQVLGRVYSKSVDFQQLVRRLPDVQLGSWDRPDDDHLLEVARAAGNCPCLTTEVANVQARDEVAEALAIAVLDAGGAWELANSRPPCDSKT